MKVQDPAIFPQFGPRFDRINITHDTLSFDSFISKCKDF